MAPWHSLPCCWVVVLMLCGIVTIHIQTVDAAFGTNCTDDATQCVGPTEICDNNTSCRCAGGYIQDTNNNICRRAGHGEECSGDDNSVCNETSLICVSYQSNPKRCLCDQNSYRPSQGSCKALSELRVTLLTDKTIRETAQITLDWNGVNNPGRNDVTYAITDSSGTPYNNQNGKTVAGLTSGMSYSFQVISSLPADQYYPVKNATSKPVYTVWTKFNYEQQCDTAPAGDICNGTNIDCINEKDDPNTSKRCLCTKEFYRTKIGPPSCNPLSELRVTLLPDKTVRETAQITLDWNSVNNPGRNDVTYAITDSSGTPYNNQNGKTVAGLTSGTSYSFQVISSLPADQYYPVKSATSKPVYTVWTKFNYEQQCDTAPARDICDGTNIDCINERDDSSRGKRCLCTKEFYRTNNGSPSCNRLSELRVTLLPDKTVRETAQITLDWNVVNNPGRNDVIYTITDNSGISYNNQNGKTVSGLTPGTSYNFQVISSLPADQYYPMKSATSNPVNTVWTKFNYEQQCDTAPARDICDGTNIDCINEREDPNTSKRCLCTKEFYRTNNGSPSCNPLSDLRVTLLSDKTVRETAQITLDWNVVNNPDRNDVTYTITDNRGTSYNNQNGKTVSGLTPGTSYNFQVISSLPADQYYPVKSATSNPVYTVWTKPAQPGPVQDPLLDTKLDDGSFRYIVRFQRSAGNAASYTMTVTGNGINETQSGQRTTISTSQPVQMQFYQLKPTLTYNYILTAYNGKSPPDSSEPRRGEFRAKAKESGPVHLLKAISKGEDNASVEWQTPESQNGDIAGYQIEVKEGQNCLYAITISCSNCGQSLPPASPTTCQVKDSSDRTFAYLNNNSSTYTQVLSDLEPYHNYTVIVSALNEDGPGAPSNESFTTDIAVANMVTDLEMNSTRDGGTGGIALNIHWTAGEFTGPTHYDIFVEEEISLNSGDYMAVSNGRQKLTGYGNTNSLLPNVLAYWNYKVSVTAGTSKGNSGNKTEFYRTVESIPGLVQNLTVEQHDAIAQELIIKITCPEEKQRNGPIANYVVQKVLLDTDGQPVSVNDSVLPATSSSSCITTYNARDVGGIMVERNYTFAVKVHNKMYQGNFSSAVPFSVEPKPPSLSRAVSTHGESKLIGKPEDAKQYQDKVEVSVCAKCLLDSSQGTVTDVGLVVCVKSETNPCDDSGRKKRAVEDYRNLQSWAEANAKGYSQQYRTTPNNWMSVLNSNGSKTYNYTVGVDASCVSTNGGYCNGPLPGNKDIIISAIACNTADCDMVRADGVFVTRVPEDDDVNIAAIVGGVIGALVVFGIIAVAIIVLWRRRHKHKPATRSRNPVVSLYEISSQKRERPVHMRDFADHVAKFHKDCNLLFQDEFDDIKTISATFSNTVDEAQRERNRVKNRYVDILPYDHSRVKLVVQPEDDDTTDFINANYILGYNSVREYIATQGPMHCTIPDFWRMVWEQKCKVIVMLSDLIENGKRKVDMYWPENLNEPINYDSVVVEMTNFSQLNKYIIRNFLLMKGKETFKVTHFFLPGWEDFQANLDNEDILEFTRLVKQEATPANSGPIIVHCSAGVGRTGTFIALDYYMQYIEKHSLDDQIDIFNFVLEMRKNRPRMVQAEIQYIFIYEVVKELIDKKKKAEEERLYDNMGPNNLYANMGQQQQQEENVYANTSPKEDKFAYENEAFESEYQNMEKAKKEEKPTTEL